MSKTYLIIKYKDTSKSDTPYIIRAFLISSRLFNFFKCVLLSNDIVALKRVEERGISHFRLLLMGAV